MTKKVFLIAGKSANGKSAFADALEEMLNLNNKKVMRIAYADYLKFILQKYFHWNGEKDKRGRELLQRVGTNLIRAKHPNYWVDTASNLVRSLESEFDYIIIDDVRFVNEIECFTTDEAYTIWVERYNTDGSRYYNPSMTPEQLTHESETALDDYPSFDYVVENRGGLYDLTQSAFKIVEDVLHD